MAGTVPAEAPFHTPVFVVTHDEREAWGLRQSA
jgi:hypothetical protein